MAIDGLHHLVLEVPDLADAERFYRELFDLDVLFREGTKDGTFGALPEGLDWAGAADRGVEPGMTFLGRDGFALALAEADREGDADRPSHAASGTASLDHVALAVDAADRDAVRDRAAELGCEFEEESDAVFVVDRYGVEWELNASSPPPETPFDPLDV